MPETRRRRESREGAQGTELLRTLGKSAVRQGLRDRRWDYCTRKELHVDREKSSLHMAARDTTKQELAFNLPRTLSPFVSPYCAGRMSINQKAALGRRVSGHPTPGRGWTVTWRADLRPTRPPSYHIAFLLTLVGGSPWKLHPRNPHLPPLKICSLILQRRAFDP